jgi:hypothetical protein
VARHCDLKDVPCHLSTGCEQDFTLTLDVVLVDIMYLHVAF